jgi:hypothetical protein
MDLAKSVFLAVNASLCWLNNVVGVYLVKVSLLLIGQQVWDISSGSALASHWLEDCENFTPMPAPTTLSAMQAASQSTFINEQLYSTCD